MFTYVSAVTHSLENSDLYESSSLILSLIRIFEENATVFKILNPQISKQADIISGQDSRERVK